MAKAKTVENFRKRWRRAATLAEQKMFAAARAGKPRLLASALREVKNPLGCADRDETLWEAAARSKAPGSGACARAIMGLPGAWGQNSRGMDPCSVAAKEGNLPALREMIAQRPAHMPWSQDKAGKTALSWAAEQSCAEAVRLLMAAGCGARLADKRSQTPLMGAVEQGASALEMVEALAPESDLDARDSAGASALMQAAQDGCLPLVMALLPGSDAFGVDREGLTALMRAAGSDGGDAVGCVKALLPASDPWAKDEGGRTALALCVEAQAVEALACAMLARAEPVDALVEWAMALGVARSREAGCDARVAVLEPLVASLAQRVELGLATPGAKALAGTKAGRL